MTEKSSYKSAIGLRGDMLYCPLPLSVDSYWNCEPDCFHCYSRRLNRVWGMDLRPADPDAVRKKLENGLANQNPKSSLAHALALKKTIRVGNRTDPYQPAEIKHKVTRRILRHLLDLRWTFAIQTRFLHHMMRDEDLLVKAHKRKLLTIIAVVSPGAEYDWEVLEKKITTPIPQRIEILKEAVRRGWNVGVNGEPFIPGLHKPSQFRKILQRLKAIGIKSYNTYNLHFNDHVAKQLHSIGIDIEKIWEMNQDKPWRKIHQKLCQIAKEEGMRLGCPDFVNTGPDWREEANTCCGVNVPNPSKFNSHYWKEALQDGDHPDEVFADTWEGIGDKEEGLKIINGKCSDMYTMKDAGMIEGDSGGLL